MPKTTNKRKNDYRRNDRAPEQGAQEQATPEDNHSGLANVIPPRLLKKLRRIPRLAELESMFDEPTSSSEDNNPPTTAAFPNNTESTDTPTVATLLSNIDPDNMPSTSSGITARHTEPLPPSTDTDSDNGNNSNQDVNNPNDNNDNESEADVSSDDTDDEDVSPMVDKSTNTLETYRNKFRYRGNMCMINDINVEESDTSINILLSLFQIPHSSIRQSPISNLNAITESRSVEVEPGAAGVSDDSGLQKVSVAVQTDVEPQNLNFNRSNELQPVRQHRNERPNVTKLSIKSGKYMLNIFPPVTNQNEQGRARIAGESSSENNTMMSNNNYGVEVFNVNNRTYRGTGGETLGDCPICLDKLNSNDLASTLCGHVFCLRCISAVVQSENKKCPTCRKTLTKKCFHELYL